MLSQAKRFPRATFLSLKHCETKKPGWLFWHLCLGTLMSLISLDKVRITSDALLLLVYWEWSVVGGVEWCFRERWWKIRLSPWAWVHVQLFCDSRDCSPPGFPVHWILQARILELVAMPSSRRSSRPRARTPVFFVFCYLPVVFYNSRKV